MVSHFHLQVKIKNFGSSKKNCKYYKILFNGQNDETRNW